MLVERLPALASLGGFGHFWSQHTHLHTFSPIFTHFHSKFTQNLPTIPKFTHIFPISPVSPTFSPLPHTHSKLICPCSHTTRTVTLLLKSHGRHLSCGEHKWTLTYQFHGLWCISPDRGGLSCQHTGSFTHNVKLLKWLSVEVDQFIITDKARGSRGGGERCRCYERRLLKS